MPQYQILLSFSRQSVQSVRRFFLAFSPCSVPPCSSSTKQMHVRRFARLSRLTTCTPLAVHMSAPTRFAGTTGHPIGETKSGLAVGADHGKVLTKLELKQRPSQRKGVRLLLLPSASTICFWLTVCGKLPSHRFAETQQARLLCSGSHPRGMCTTVQPPLVAEYGWPTLLRAFFLPSALATRALFSFSSSGAFLLVARKTQ